MSSKTEKDQGSIPAEESSPFDTKVLLERCMGNEKIAHLVLDKLAAQLPGDVEKLTESTAAGDCVRTAQVAHALKGAAGTVAASSLREFAAQIEKFGRDNQIEKTKECLAELTREVERCLNFVPNAKAALSRPAA